MAHAEPTDVRTLALIPVGSMDNVLVELRSKGHAELATALEAVRDTWQHVAAAVHVEACAEAGCTVIGKHYHLNRERPRDEVHAP